MSQLTICLVIFSLMLLSYALNKIPMGLTALLTLVALVLTGCLSPSEALSGFASKNTVIIAGMFVVSAGLGKTSFINKLTDYVARRSGGSFKKAYLGMILLSVAITSVLTSPMVAYGIIFPFAAAMCRRFGVNASKIQYTLCIICISCCCILPCGNAITYAGVYSGYYEAYQIVNYNFSAMDFTVGRIPVLIIVPLWAYFVAPRFAPDGLAEFGENKKGEIKSDQELSPFSDIAGAVIFFAVVIALFFARNIGIEAWIIVLTGALAMVLCKTLKEREAFAALPHSILFVYISALAMANALSSTGAGDVVGQWIVKLVGGTHDNYLLGAIFFLIPFGLTQFMLNQGVMNIFAPICLLFCKQMGANPTGLMVLISAGAHSAFMTPMATPAIPMCMGAGGYGLKHLLSQGWFIAFLLSVLHIFYTMTVLPAF